MARLKGTLINRRIIWSAGFGKKRRLIFQDTGETGEKTFPAATWTQPNLSANFHDRICCFSCNLFQKVLKTWPKIWLRSHTKIRWRAFPRTRSIRGLVVETRVLFLSLPVFCLRTLSSVFSFNLFYFSWLDTGSSLKLHDSCWLSNRSRKQCFLMK